jgi:2-keto-4-pentenoate hydratase
MVADFIGPRLWRNTGEIACPRVATEAAQGLHRGKERVFPFRRVPRMASWSDPSDRPRPPMTPADANPRIGEIAQEVIAALRTGTQVRPFSARYPGFTLADAYEVAQRVHGIRVASGAGTLGRKIGFTNRTVWDSYGLSAPIWGYMYSDTVHDLSSIEARFTLAGLSEPRIEPEIVLHVTGSPYPEMSDDALLTCIDWVAHGFEIVHSIFPGWAFDASDAVAAQGVHAALLIGERHPVSGDRKRWQEALSTFEIALLQNGEITTRGQGHDVLGGPIEALRFLLRELTRRPASERLRSGEVITTGTLTQAMPAIPGDTWTTVLKGIDVEGLRLRFA